MKLVIISHTTHYHRDNVIVGWSPTVREINFLTSVADSITHVAPLSAEPAPGFGEAYISNVSFVPMPIVGGDGLINKLSILWSLPRIIGIVLRELKGADYFQFRAPTGIGVYLIPLLTISRKKGWFKFAGNWSTREYPLSYKLQRWWLKHATRKKVTINGRWPGQQPHVLSFDNPCLTNEELVVAKTAASKKDFSEKLTILFVGRLSKAKGMDLIVEILNASKSKQDIEKVVFIGDGDPTPYQSRIDPQIKTLFVGNVRREEINDYYTDAHIFLLPSYSEGFPKVLAESGSFGCVPAISNVSAIGQYISSSNGLLFDTFDPGPMTVQFDDLLQNREGLKEKSGNMAKLADRFSYDVYNNRIKNEILNEAAGGQ